MTSLLNSRAFNPLTILLSIDRHTLTYWLDLTVLFRLHQFPTWNIRFLPIYFRPVALSIIHDYWFINDLASLLSFEKEATTVKQEISFALSSKKLSVKRWHSNSEIVNEFEDFLVDVLGYQWNKSRDTFKTKIPELTLPKVVIKHKVLSCIAKLWDSIEILVPKALKLRLLLQD